MSGGSFSYLCYKDASELMGCTDELDRMRDILICLNYTDIAQDVQRLIEYIKSATITIETLSEMLNEVFYAVEWYYSADWGKDEMLKVLNDYRLNHGVKEAK